MWLHYDGIHSFYVTSNRQLELQSCLKSKFIIISPLYIYIIFVWLHIYIDNIKWIIDDLALHFSAYTMYILWIKPLKMTHTRNDNIAINHKTQNWCFMLLLIE